MGAGSRAGWRSRRRPDRRRARSRAGPPGRGRPRLLVAVHPTRGVDIGATETIHRLLREQRASGVATLLISEDLDELLLLADRIAVLYEGRVMGTVDARTADREHLGLLMAGISAHADDAPVASPVETVASGG